MENCMSRAGFPNIGVRHGAWGENVASSYLRKRGFIIVDRNSRPCRRNRTLEIDIVAYEQKSDTLVFVEVKQHKSFSRYQSRLRSIDKQKLSNLRRACVNWVKTKDWDGGYRFDVIEIYGAPESGSPEIDHIENVQLFTSKERRVAWK